MRNRIAILKESYNRMVIAPRKRDEELYEIETANDVFKPMNTDEAIEDLNANTGLVSHLGTGCRRTMPFILL